MPRSNRISVPFAVAFCFLLLGFASLADAQAKESKKKKAFRITEKVSVKVLKSTAKITYETAKLIGKQIVVTAAKHVVVPMANATPPAAEAGVKLAGKGIKNGAKGVAKIVRGLSDSNSDDRSAIRPVDQDKVDN